MAALPITHDWSELFGKDRRQRRQISGGVVGDAKDGADCVLIPRLGIDCHIDANLSLRTPIQLSFEKLREDHGAGYSYRSLRRPGRAV